MDIIALAQETSLNGSRTSEECTTDKAHHKSKRKKRLKKSLLFSIGLLAIVLCMLEVFLVFFQRSNPEDWLKFAQIFMRHNQSKLNC